MKLYRKSTLYFIAFVLAILNGVTNFSVFHEAALFISQAFIQLFKTISLPIIALSILVTLLKYEAGSMKTAWQKTLIYALSTTFVAACVSFVLYLILQPDNVVYEHHLAHIDTSKNYLTHVSSLIPGNLFSPFINQQVISVLLISLAVGAAIRQIPDKTAQQTVKHFFIGMHGAFLVITKWIIAILPIGLFGFISATVIQLRSGMSLHGLLKYLSIIVLSNLIQGFVILPLWLKTKGLKPYHLMKLMKPALALAFFSKSSVGTLPVTMANAEKRLAIKPEISRFIFPLCTSINMNGCAAFIFTTVLFVMQNNGIQTSVMTMFVWVIIATIAAVGNAGVPMGCFFLSTSLLVSMNVPIELMGLILPFYSLIDMLETSLNVWSDISITKVVNDEITREAVS